MQLFFRVFLFGCVCVCVVLLVKRNLNTPPLFQNPGSATHAKSPVFTRLTAAYTAALIRVNGMSTQNGIQFYVHQALKKNCLRLALFGQCIQRNISVKIQMLSNCSIFVFLKIIHFESRLYYREFLAR